VNAWLYLRPQNGSDSRSGEAPERDSQAAVLPKMRIAGKTGCFQDVAVVFFGGGEEPVLTLGVTGFR
jgi:hypothetical protein